jgi:hypothetical protein
VSVFIILLSLVVVVVMTVTVSILSSRSRNVSRASTVLGFRDLIQILIPFLITFNFKILNYPCSPQL